MQKGYAEKIFKELAARRSAPRREGELAQKIVSELNDLNLQVKTDGAGEKIGGTTDNLIIEADTQAPKNTLLVAHIDAVKSKTTEPIRSDGFIKNRAEGALGADDLVGVSVILALLRAKRDHLPPGLGIIFTVAEEIGLLGASLLPGDYVKRYDHAIVMDGEAPAGTIFYEEPAAGFFAFTLTRRNDGEEMTARQKMLLRRIRHYWEKNDLCVVSHLIPGPLPVWEFFQEEILIVGIRGEEISRINSLWQRRIKELQRHFGIRRSDFVSRVLHFCSGYNFESIPPWLSSLKSSLQSTGLDVEFQKSSHISEANKMSQFGLESVNLGMGYSHGHTSREKLDISSLKALEKALYFYTKGSE